MAEAVLQKTTYAGFWRRWGALIIDGVIVEIVTLLPEHVLSEKASAIVAGLFFLSYVILFDASFMRGTPGKRFVGLWVGALNHKKITVLQSLARQMALMIVSLPLILYGLSVVNSEEFKNLAQAQKSRQEQQEANVEQTRNVDQGKYKINPLRFMEMDTNLPHLTASKPHLTASTKTKRMKEILMPVLWLALVTGVLNFFIYALPIAFTKQKTGLHDWLTKTRVYYGPIPVDAAKEGASHAVT